MIDFDAAWGLFLGVRSVLYRPYRADETLGPGVPCDAFPTGGPAKDTAADMHATTREWCLRASHLGATAVTERGQVVDADGTVWLVEACEDRTFRTRVWCRCTRIG